MSINCVMVYSRALYRVLNYPYSLKINNKSQQKYKILLWYIYMRKCVIIWEFFPKGFFAYLTISGLSAFTSDYYLSICHSSTSDGGGI